MKEIQVTVRIKLHIDESFFRIFVCKIDFYTFDECL